MGDLAQYLKSICDEYSSFKDIYTPTDVSGPVQDDVAATSHLLQLEFMVQTAGEKIDATRVPVAAPGTEKLKALEALRKYAGQHMLLNGRPGSGKTTTLRRFLVERAEEALAQEPPYPSIPILVELKNYKSDILSLVRDFMMGHGWLAEPHEIEKLLFEGRLLLLADGINELPSETARRDLQSFRNGFRAKTPMIFTTREIGIGGDMGIDMKLEMLPLSDAQVDEFARAYLGEKAAAMLERLSDRVRDMARTPLFLWMLCSVFAEGDEIPSNLGAVFRRFTQLYAKTLKADLPVTDESRRVWPDLLACLGFRMIQGNDPLETLVTIPRQTAEKLIADYLEARSFDSPPSRAAAYLDDLLKHHLLVLTSDGSIQFIHQLIQEYFSAEYLLNFFPAVKDEDLKRDYLNYLKWTEPAAMMLELMDNRDEVLRTVRLGLEVDLMLGAKLAGASKEEFQGDTVNLVAEHKLPIGLKMRLLGATRSRHAFGHIADGFNSEDFAARFEAVVGWSQLRGEAGAQALIGALKDADPLVAAVAAFALVEIGGDAATEALDDALRNGGTDVTIVTAIAVSLIKRDKITTALIDAFKRDDPRLSGLGAVSLGLIGPDKGVQALIDAFKHGHWSVRGTAAWTLSNTGGTAAVQALIDVLKDESVSVRCKAAKALGKIGGDEAAEALTRALNDENLAVQTIAAVALAGMGRGSGAEAAIEGLLHKDSDVRQAAVEAISKIGGNLAIKALVDSLSDRDSDVRKAAVTALGKIGGDRAVQTLMEALNGRDVEMQSSAASALGETGDRRAIEPLARLILSQDRAGFLPRLSQIQQRCGFYGSSLSIFVEKPPAPKEDEFKLYSVTGEAKAEMAITVDPADERFYLLHLSDLHFSGHLHRTVEDAKVWFGQLLPDILKDLRCPRVDALVLSGDIADKADWDEYLGAKWFLEKFLEDFRMSPRQVLIVPGNHDVDWRESCNSYLLTWKLAYDGPMDPELCHDRGDGVLAVLDEARYSARFQSFAEFYQGIKGEPFPMSYEDQVLFSHFPDHKLLIMGLNSAWRTDHLNKARAEIHRAAVSHGVRQTLKQYDDCTKIAVWHHPLKSEGEDRIKQDDFMEQLAVSGFRLALHGHVHKADSDLFRYDSTPKGRRIEIVGAGTFGAATRELVTGYPWQYNLIIIDKGKVVVKTRKREKVNGSWKPDARWTQGPGEDPRSYYEIDLAD